MVVPRPNVLFVFADQLRAMSMGCAGNPDVRRQDGGDWLLFDDADDSYQMTNRVDDPAYAAARRELAVELDGWLQRTGDRVLTGPDVLRDLGLVELWNARERALHPGAPLLLDGATESTHTASG